jgi:hypothetical protein
MKTTLFNSKGHSLGIYPTRAEAEDALRRRPDAVGGFVAPVPTPKPWIRGMA